MFPCDVESPGNQPPTQNSIVFEDVEKEITTKPDLNKFDRQRSERIALSVLDLSQRLTENIISQSKRKYEIVSPISIASALQLVLLGAHGMTFNELMDL